jgi:hypothetical protein
MLTVERLSGLLHSACSIPHSAFLQLHPSHHIRPAAEKSLEIGNGDGETMRVEIRVKDQLLGRSKILVDDDPHVLRPLMQKTEW